MPLTETTNEALTGEKGAEGTTTVDPAKDGKPRAPRERKQRGPPEDGVPSKIKVMVANLPYDLNEDKVSAPREISCWLEAANAQLAAQGTLHRILPILR